MSGESGFVDWTNLRAQAHWYALRHEFEGEIRGAISDIRKQFAVDVRMNTATIATDGDRSVLRIPVSAIYSDRLEQTIAVILVTSTEEDEPRIAAIAGNIARLLERWLYTDVPVGAAPTFLYPETEDRWPAESLPPAAPVPAAEASSTAATA